MAEAHVPAQVLIKCVHSLSSLVVNCNGHWLLLSTQALSPSLGNWGPLLYHIMNLSICAHYWPKLREVVALLCSLHFYTLIVKVTCDELFVPIVENEMGIFKETHDVKIWGNNWRNKDLVNNRWLFLEKYLYRVIIQYFNNILFLIQHVWFIRYFVIKWHCIL